MKSQQISRPVISNVVVVCICILFALAGSAINVHRFYQYDLGYYDFGIFESSIWKVSQFKAPIIDHLLLSGKINLADHFTPTLYLLAPLYWFFPYSETILVAQSCIVAASAWVLFQIAKKKLQSEFASFSVFIAYLAYTGLQNAVFSDFHELTNVTLPLMLLLWSIIENKKKLFYFLLLLTLGLKESLFILGIGLSVFIFFNKKSWRKVAFYTFLISVIYGYMTIEIIIPFFAHTKYIYSPNNLGNIANVFKNLFIPEVKIKTVFNTFLSFSFLPLLNPPSAIMVMLNLFTRFLTEGEIRWDMGMHYNAEIAPTLAVGTIFGLDKLKKINRFVYRFSFIFLLILSLFLFRFVFHGPMALSYHPAFYQHTKNMDFLDPMIAVVPKNVRVTAQNNLASMFLHQDVWILKDNYLEHDPDYILIDVRNGQKGANHLGIQDIQKLLNNLLTDENYVVVYNSNDEQYVFKRK